MIVPWGQSDTASAHEKRIARQGLITVRAAPEGIEIDALVIMRVAGERAFSVLARSDLNRDGELNEGEGTLLADSISPDVLGGLVLRQGSVALRPTAAEGRARKVARDAVEIAILVTWPAALTAGTHFSIMETVGHMGATSTAIQMQASAIAPLRLKAQKSPGKDGLVGPVVLTPDGQALSFSVEAQPTARTGAAPVR